MDVKVKCSQLSVVPREGEGRLVHELLVREVPDAVWKHIHAICRRLRVEVRCRPVFSHRTGLVYPSGSQSNMPEAVLRIVENNPRERAVVIAHSLLVILLPAGGYCYKESHVNFNGFNFEALN